MWISQELGELLAPCMQESKYPFQLKLNIQHWTIIRIENQTA